MAEVLGEKSGPFEMVLENLLSTSNERRGQAEAVFTECKKHPSLLVTKLLQSLRTSTNQGIRIQCAVLLRKVFSKDKIWGNMDGSTQAMVKVELLQCVQMEADKSIIRKLCDTVAVLATEILEKGTWPELLPFMFQCVSGSDDRLKEASLLIFAHLAAEIAETLTPYLDTLLTLFQQCLSQSTNSDVRITALRASTTFIQTLEGKELEKFHALLPSMLQTLTLALNNKEEEAAQEALGMFIEVGGTNPRFLRRQLQDILLMMLQIAEAAELDEGTRQLAVEFLVTLIEAREGAPGMMRKLSHVNGRLFAVLLKMLLDIEDDPKWYTVDKEDDLESDSTDYEMAQECLDRVALALQGNSLLPVASQLLPPYLADSDWKKRHAGLIALSQIAEGCAKVMITSLDSVVAMVLTGFRDPHPRVRWAAINAMGQLATDLGPDLQEAHHQRALPALILAMEDFNTPRIQAHAAAAVLNFSESATPEVMTPYLDAIISKLLILLQTNKRMVQEGALTALAAVADCAQEHFSKYYDAVMPFLKMILVGCVNKDDRMLRSKALECISLVGMAVGKEKFRADAKQVMDVLLQLQGTETEDDDPTTGYLLQAWARLCKCLGQEFLPYMGVVMPPLLKSAGLKTVTVTDADSDAEDDNDDEEEDGVETITIGEKQIGIRTSALEEKATACSMLCCYVDELKECFYPWIEEVAQLMVPLLKFYFHEEVRKAAISAMPELLLAGKLAVEKGVAVGRDQSYVKQLTDFLVPPLVEVLHKEQEVEICVEVLEALTECILISGSLLDGAQIKSLMDELCLVIEASRGRRVERFMQRHAEDFDDEESERLEEENDQEDMVFEQAAEVVGQLMKTFKGEFEPFFDVLVPALQPSLQTTSVPSELRAVICIFDDAVEYMADKAWKYYDVFLPIVLSSCTHNDMDVRQAAVWGIGVCAQFGGATFAPRIGEALQKLSEVVSSPSCRDEEHVMATDNAISAIGKMCLYQREAFDVAQVLPTWLAYLPMKGDLGEAQIVHEQLCGMVERSDPVLLSEANRATNLPKIIAVFAEVLMEGTKLATEETAERMVKLLRQLQLTCPPDLRAASWNALLPEQQAWLQTILASSVGTSGPNGGS
eukprot:TRINITY_DN5787_c0_g1_i1.p1 TRINITY_DN5787_c0_g1~~TRINITY_DN5787_c0_g1_i1.p1  ORF type:complete len:1153 (+),score=248.27 TRINITY_DN5787_c0_g1_i1:117-3461(+)